MTNPYLCPSSDSEIVDVVLSIGEKISDITLYQYQRQFAQRIVESVIKKDAETITALFSRQCVTPDTRILTPTGSKAIETLKVGDEVISTVNGVLVKDKIQDIWSNTRPTREIRFKSAKRVTATEFTRFYDGLTESWEAIVPNGKHSRKRALRLPLLTVNNCELSEGTPTNTPIQTQADTKKSAEQALLLLYGRDDPHNYIQSLLGTRLNCYFHTNTGFEKFRKALGLELDQTSSEGMYKTIVLSEIPELDCDYINQYRKSVLEFVLADSGYLRPTKDLIFDVRSTGVYNHTLVSFLNTMAINTHFNDRSAKVTGLTSILLALPALLDNVDYKRIHGDVFLASRYDSIARISTKDALEIIASDKGVKKNLTSHVDKRKKMLSLGGFARAYITRYGYDAWNSVCPNWQYDKTTEYVFTRDQLVYDMETETTGNFFANEMLVHNCGKSEALKIAVLGLTLWMPALAKTYPQDKRFERFNNGFWVGLFAPNLKTQVKSIYNRIRNTLKSKHGKAFMAGLDVEFVINQAFEYVLDNGSRVYGGAASINANIESQTFHLVIGDEAQDIDSFKWKKSIVPMTTFTAGSKVMVGTANTIKSNFWDTIERNKKALDGGKKQNHFQVDYTIPARENENYAISVSEAIRELGWDSDEFQMAYNNKFIFSRGMAIDPELLNFNSKEHPRGIVFDHEYQQYYSGTNKTVVGIDVGKKHDPSVLTCVEVDVEDVVVMGQFRVFKKKEVCKMEILGDDIEAQVPQMLDFIERMRASTVVVDATGGGDHFFDMLRKRAPNLNWIPFVFSQKSRSELWKMFLSDISTGRVHLAGGKETQEKVEYYKTLKELAELEKHYNGQYLACQAPQTRNAHDDYAVSLALACWACKDHFIGELEVQRGFFKSRRRHNKRRRR